MSGADIIGLVPKKETSLEPSLPLVEFLEELLEQAKTGELRGLAGACNYKDGCGYHVMGWAGGFEMLGALHTAAYAQAGLDEEE